MSKSIQEILNEHLAKFPYVLIEQVDGKVYLLPEHWRYVNARLEAPRVLLGKGAISSNRFEYLTKLFPIRKQKPILTRKKFNK